MADTVSIRPIVTVLAIVGALGIASQTAAQQGEWRIGARLLSVNTDATTEQIVDPGSEIAFDSSWGLDFDATFMAGANWGIEWMLATEPHDLQASGGEVQGLDIGEVWLAQSTLTLSYHIPLWGKWKPYVGAGIGLGYLHSSSTTDAAEAVDIHDIRSDVFLGAVGQVGVTYRCGRSWMLGLDIKYNGASGDVKIKNVDGDTAYTLATDLDALLVGVGAAYRFR